LPVYILYMVIKVHPFEIEKDKNIVLGPKKLDEHVKELIDKVESDINARSGLANKLKKWFRRRHQLDFQDPRMPFSGSSRFTPPLIDMEVDKSKPPLMNLINANPVVTFRPNNAESVERADYAEEQMQWLLFSRMRDFEKQYEIGTDHFGQNGWVYFKVIYEWRTRISKEIIRKDRFSEEQKNIIFQAVFIMENPEAVPETQPAEVLPEGEEPIDIVERTKILFESFLEEEFGLSTEDSADVEAVRKLKKFFSSDQQQVTLSKREVFQDAPVMESIEPMFLVPSRGTRDLRDTERITEIKFYTKNDIAMRGRDGFFDPKAVKQLLRELDDADKKTSSRNSTVMALEVEKSQLEGVNLESIDDDLIEVHEIYHYFDIDGDDIQEKVVMMVQPDHNIVLKFIELPYDDGEWPYVQIKREEKDNRESSSRGLPEILDQIDREIIFNHRMKANGMMIANAPTFKFKINSNIQPGSFKWIPGQFYPVMDMGDIEPLVIPSHDRSHDNEENILINWVERRTGSVEAALTRQGTLNEPRTKAEIDTISAIGQQNLTLTLKRWQRGMSEVYRKIWSRWMQFGPANIIVRLSSGRVQPMTKNQVNGEFDIVPSGTVGNSNPALLAQRAMARFQLMLQLTLQGGSKLLGNKFGLDLAAAFMDAMNKDDPVMAQKLLPPLPDTQTQQLNQQESAFQADIRAAQTNQPLSMERLERVIKASPFGKQQAVAT